ncbi:MAG TPA: Calx-beta domain-containing protein [Solirubrobacteraceae bacterium]|nr:Calx-beta domain-containing protein [Solirubrobacteraceae bacterium]
MHRRAARTLVAALAAAALVAPAGASAHTFGTHSTSEGDDLVFEFSLPELPGQFDPEEGPAPAATEDVDFEGEPLLPTPPNTVRVPTIEDDVDEPTENVRLVAPDGHEAVGTIVDDDNPPALSISDLSVPENDAAEAKLTITAPNPSSVDIVIPLSVTPGGTEVRVPATVTLPALQTSVDVPVTVANDFEDELDEQFTVVLGDPEGANLADPEGVVTVVNDDLRVVDVFDASTPEGDGGTSVARFVFQLNAPTFRTVVVGYTTADGIARAPADYLARLGSITFRPGETQHAVDVPVVGDDVREDAEAFAMWMTGINDAARIGDGVAVGVIVDDDGEGPLGIGGGGGSGSGSGSGSGAGSGSASADRRPPQMTLGPPRRSGRRITMRVGCPSGERTCAGRLTLFTVPDRRSRSRTLRRERRIGAKSFRLRGGRSTTVSIAVPRSILRAAQRAGRLKLQAFAVTQDAAENVDTRTTRATLRYRRTRRS